MKKKMNRKLMLTLLGAGIMLIVLGGVVYAIESGCSDVPDIYGVGC
jgi:hypothetical protein